MSNAARRRSAPRPGRPPAGVGGLRVRDYPQVSIRVPPQFREKLNALIRATGLSQLELLVRAVECFQRQLGRAERRRMRPRPAQ